jgi:hypothetical protein
MSEAPAPQTFYRRACLADFFAADEETPAQFSQDRYNKHQNDNVVIAKNQPEFGHRKRIKP